MSLNDKIFSFRYPFSPSEFLLLFQDSTRAITKGVYTGQYYSGSTNAAGFAHGFGEVTGDNTSLKGVFVDGVPSIGVTKHWLGTKLMSTYDEQGQLHGAVPIVYADAHEVNIYDHGTCVDKILGQLNLHQFMCVVADDFHIIWSDYGAYRHRTI